jgi:hypothetical protein
MFVFNIKLINNTSVYLVIIQHIASCNIFILFSTGFGMIATDKKYKFNCCGTINKWRARAGAPGEVAFQVWRPTGKKGEYKLMGQNVVKCTYCVRIKHLNVCFL